jgi:hypothetical protein
VGHPPRMFTWRINLDFQLLLDINDTLKSPKKKKQIGKAPPIINLSTEINTEIFLRTEYFGFFFY